MVDSTGGFRGYVGCRRPLRDPAPHKTVTRAGVRFGLKYLAHAGQGAVGCRNRRVDARVVPTIETIDRSVDPRELGHVSRPSPVKNESRREILVVGREAKRLRSAPAESGDKNLSVSSRKPPHIIRDRRKIGRHLPGRQLVNGGTSGV